MDNAFTYKILHQYGTDINLVMDEVSGDVLISKRLSFYDRSVYEYLNTHHDKHIPKVYKLLEGTDGSLTVIEEYIRGNTFDVIINDQKMRPARKQKYFIELLEGLKFLHNAPVPIIHRDLKPSNILVTEDDRMVIIDYDAAKTYKDGQDQDTILLGTEGRAAPEQYGFMQSDARTDIYAVGRMIKDAFPSDKRFQKIADKAMSFDPSDRYDSADTLQKVIQRKISITARLKPLFPPPGFRTMTWWKIPIALLGYFFFFYCAATMTVDSAKLPELILTRFFFLLYCLTCIDMCNSWTGIFDVFPFINDERLYIRYPIRIFYMSAAFFIMFICLLLATGLVRNFTL